VVLENGGLGAGAQRHDAEHEGDAVAGYRHVQAAVGGGIDRRHGPTGDAIADTQPVSNGAATVAVSCRVCLSVLNCEPMEGGRAGGAIGAVEGTLGIPASERNV